jgi:cytokinesis protein
MNDANKQARGFKLSSLARLAMVKDDKNQSTLADLVERIVRNQYSEWESFSEDIAGVMTAQKVNIEQLQSDAKKYIENITNVQKALDSGSLSDPKKFHPQDRVAQIVGRCMKDARRKAEQMEVYLEEMVRTYNDIMTFYGEDPSDDNARRDFFAKLALFLSEWKRSHEKNVLLEEQRRKNEASMKRKNALKAAQTASESNPASPTSTGAMDSLLEKLRAAAPQTRDQRDRRRRARLKDRHQVRVASGQKAPDLAQLAALDAAGGLPPIPDAASEAAGTSGNDDPNNAAPSDLASPTAGQPGDGDGGSAAAGEDDVAQRAAMLLQGMRSGADGADDPADAEKRENLRRSRRQTADEERRMRRRRREQAQSGTGEGGGGRSLSRDGSMVDGSGGAGGDEEVPPTPGLDEMAAAVAAAGEAVNGER